MNSSVLKHSPLTEIALSTCYEVVDTLSKEQLSQVTDALDAFLCQRSTFHDVSQIITPILGTEKPLEKLSEIITTPDPPIPYAPNSYNLSGLAPGRVKTRQWSAYEDRRLLAGLHKFGPQDWHIISNYVGNGRTKAQCAQRWQRGLDPRIKKTPWSPEQDAQLLHTVELYGQKRWTRISECIGDRSDVQCRYRYHQLQKEEGFDLKIKLPSDTSEDDLDDDAIPERHKKSKNKSKSKNAAKNHLPPPLPPPTQTASQIQQQQQQQQKMPVMPFYSGPNMMYPQSFAMYQQMMPNMMHPGAAQSGKDNTGVVGQFAPVFAPPMMQMMPVIPMAQMMQMPQQQQQQMQMQAPTEQNTKQRQEDNNVKDIKEIAPQSLEQEKPSPTLPQSPFGVSMIPPQIKFLTPTGQLPSGEPDNFKFDDSLQLSASGSFFQWVGSSANPGNSSGSFAFNQNTETWRE